MIEVLPDMPKGVFGIRVSGRVSGDDLRELRPAWEELEQTGEIRMVKIVASDYEGFGPGGLIEDLKLSFGSVIPAIVRHRSAFKRVAVVSDKSWVTRLSGAFAWMRIYPVEVVTFSLDELERAKEWAAG